MKENEDMTNTNIYSETILSYIFTLCFWYLCYFFNWLVNVRDKNIDTLEGETLMHHPSIDIKILVLKILGRDGKKP